MSNTNLILHDKLRNNRQHSKIAINTSASLTSDTSHRQYPIYCEITKATHHINYKGNNTKKYNAHNRTPKYDILKIIK